MHPPIYGKLHPTFSTESPHFIFFLFLNFQSIWNFQAFLHFESHELHQGIFHIEDPWFLIHQRSADMDGKCWQSTNEKCRILERIKRCDGTSEEKLKDLHKIYQGWLGAVNPSWSLEPASVSSETSRGIASCFLAAIWPS